MGHDDIVATIAAMPVRFRETLAVAAHAARNYRNPTDTDLARDRNCSVRTIRRHRKRIKLLALAKRGRPARSAA